MVTRAVPASMLARQVAGRAMRLGRRYPRPGDVAHHVDPKNRSSPALDVIDDALIGLVNPRSEHDALAVFLPPQEGKSQRVSRTFSEWLLDHNPRLRIAIVSYAEELALRWGRDIKLDVQQNPCPNGGGEKCREPCGGLHIRIRQDSAAAGRWETPEGGGVYCVGIGGPLTGRPVDCLRGDTPVMTEAGYVNICDIHEAARKPRVLSFNHATGQTEWQPVTASRAVPGRRLIEVGTASGRRFTCTPDHRIATQAGYKAAQELAPGDRLIALRGLRPVVQAAGLRARQAVAQRENAVLLHASVRGGRAAESGQVVQAVRRADRFQRPRPQVLLGGMPGAFPAGTTTETLPAVRDAVHSEEQPHSLLQTGLREPCSLSADDRGGQLALQGRHQLRRMVQADATADPRTGQGVPGLSPAGPDRAPHQPRPTGLPTAEHDLALPDMSCGTPQVEDDTVAVVRELRGQRDTVYDIQVAGNSNFFAGQVLVHNCLIIDDPVKDRAAAESATIRQTAWDWWESVALTRLAPGAKVAMISTRWHEDDLAGRILSRPSPLKWRALRIPAIADSPDDPLGRAAGVELPSVRGRKPGHFRNLRATMSPYVFAGVYQQSPTAAEGNFFRKASFRYWRWTEPWADGRERILCEGQPVTLVDCWRYVTMDFAASTKSSADYTVASMWAVTPDGHLILLDRERGHVEDHEHYLMAQRLQDAWGQCTIYVEQNWWSKTFTADAINAGFGVAGMRADTDKVTRAVPAAGRVHSGRVWFPAEAPWLDEWVNELAVFPMGSHDDQVDTLSYAVRVQVSEWTPAREQGPRPGRTAWEQAVSQAHAASTGGAEVDFMNVQY